jgi:predicted dinucleotide-binding enzyme
MEKILAQLTLKNIYYKEKTKMSKKIGVLGSGVVGQVLANGFIKHGYEVMIGTGNASKHAELKEKTGGKAEVGTFEETAKFGDIIVLATKGTGAESAITSAGLSNLKGKTVLDATNPIAETPPVNGVLSFFSSLDDSLMERLQKLAPEVNFVKCFSCVGNALMVNPDFNGVKPSMFIAGNDDAAKKEVRIILDQFGWETEDMGKAEAARAIEPLCMLWCIPGFLNSEWMHAFKLLRK